MEFVNAEISND